MESGKYYLTYEYLDRVGDQSTMKIAEVPLNADTEAEAIDEAYAKLDQCVETLEGLRNSFWPWGLPSSPYNPLDDGPFHPCLICKTPSRVISKISLEK